MEETTLRIDKWLKIARFYKKRSDATEAVDSGSVKVNGERVKPAKSIKPGDVLTVKKGSQYRDYTVKGITAKSVSAAVARELYEAHEPEGITTEMSEMMKILEAQERENRRAQRGKPDKKQMRDLRKHKYGD